MYDAFKKTTLAARLRTIDRGLLHATLSVGLMTALAAPGFAMEIETDVPGLKLRWDNTIGYSVGVRTDKPSATLTQGAPALSFNDGDLNFSKRRRPITNRFDLFTEADVTWRDFGARISAAAWYDFAYQNGTSNPSGLATAGPFNQARTLNSGTPGEFPEATRTLHGRKAEVLDAFVFGKVDLGPVPLSVRLGNHALVWGESVFFGGNGIAAGMAPVDLIKLQSAPNATVKETTRPVNQISAQAVLMPGLSVAGYYQFEYERSRSAGVGSFFSTIDTIDVGGERSLLGNFGGGPATVVLQRTANQEPPDTGQGGISANFSVPDTGLDLGLYAIQYTSRAPYSYAVARPGGVSTYQLVYPQKIRAYAASFSTTLLDNITFAGEAGLRTNMPLTRGLIFLPANRLNADGDDNPAYPVGRTAHLNLSTSIGVPPYFLARSSNLTAEVAWNRVLSCTKNCVNIPGYTPRDGNADRDAYGLRLVYVPFYSQAFAGVDLAVPFGISYSPEGKSGAVGPLFVNKGGDISLGLTATVRAAYTISLRYTTYYGSEALPLNTAGFFNFGQTLKDRDNVTLAARFSF